MNQRRRGWFRLRVRALESRHLLSGLVMPSVTGDGAVERPTLPEEGRAVLVGKVTPTPTGELPADSQDNNSTAPPATTQGAVPASPAATPPDNNTTTPPAATAQTASGQKGPSEAVPATPATPQQPTAGTTAAADEASQPATDTQDAAEDVQDAAAGLETPEAAAPEAGQSASDVGQAAVTSTPPAVVSDAHAAPGPQASAPVEGLSGSGPQATAAAPAPHPGMLPAADLGDVHPGPAPREPTPPAAKVWDGANDGAVTAAAIDFWQKHALGTLDLAAFTSVPTADLLTDILPVNAAALETHVQRFLDRLDDMGRSVAEPLGGGQLHYWLAGAAAVGAALEFARRRAARSAGAVRLTGLSDVLDPDLLVPADLASPEQP
jgi:hypothetical protein